MLRTKTNIGVPNNAVRRCLLTYTPPKLIVKEWVKYSPLDFCNIYDGLSFGDIPLLEPKAGRVIWKGDPDAKYKLVCLDTSINTDMFGEVLDSFPFPLVIYPSSKDLELILDVAGGGFTDDCNGYGTVTNPGQVIAKDSPIVVKTSYPHPTVSESWGLCQ